MLYGSRHDSTGVITLKPESGCQNESTCDRTDGHAGVDMACMRAHHDARGRLCSSMSDQQARGVLAPVRLVNEASDAKLSGATWWWQIV